MRSRESTARKASDVTRAASTTATDVAPRGRARTEAGILRACTQVVHRPHVSFGYDQQVGAGGRPVIPEGHQACILAAHDQRCRPQCAHVVSGSKWLYRICAERRASYTSFEPPFATMSQNMQRLCHASAMS